MRNHIVLAAFVLCALSGKALAADIKPCDVKRNEGLKCLQDNITLLNEELKATRKALTDVTNIANRALPNGSNVQLSSFRWSGKCLDQPIASGGADQTNATNCSGETRWTISKNGPQPQ
jgi:hypothetical protein